MANKFVMPEPICQNDKFIPYAFQGLAHGHIDLDLALNSMGEMLRRLSTQASNMWLTSQNANLPVLRNSGPMSCSAPLMMSEMWMEPFGAGGIFRFSCRDNVRVVSFSILPTSHLSYPKTFI